MPVNPYADFTLDECIALKRTLVLRSTQNIKQVAHTGTGSTTRGESSKDDTNIRWLTKQIAFLRGEPDPYPEEGRIGFITMNPTSAY